MTGLNKWIGFTALTFSLLIPSLVQAQVTGTASTVKVADGGAATVGAKADAAYSGSGSGSLVSISKANYAKLAALVTLLTNGTASVATSAALGDAQGSTTALLQTPGGSNASAMMGVFPLLYNGTTWDRARGTIANGQAVDVTRLPALPAGTNSIGAVTNTALTDAWDQTNHVLSVKTNFSQAGDSTAGDNIAVRSGLTVTRGAINLSASSGDNTLIAAGTNKLKILELFIMASADTTIYFRNGAAGTALTGPLPLKANQGFFLASPTNADLDHFRTGTATALVVNSSVGSVTLSGWYVLADQS